VLGFLSVSTILFGSFLMGAAVFQSRAGFSECLDTHPPDGSTLTGWFQSRAGFSECLDWRWDAGSSDWKFQSRAGFSECLDVKVRVQSTVGDILFQSRAGFSECLDFMTEYRFRTR